MTNQNQDQQIAQLRAELAAKQTQITSLKIKVMLIKSAVKISVPSIAALSAAWVLSFTTHPNATKLTVIPEWNGPDFKVTYLCKGSFQKMEGLDMQRKGDSVTVNYGALGRRRGFRSFTCDKPMTSVSAGSR